MNIEQIFEMLVDQHLNGEDRELTDQETKTLWDQADIMHENDWCF